MYRKQRYGDEMVGSEHFKFGMDYFRKMFHQCIFLIVSDDPHWCETHLDMEKDDTFLVADYAAADLALLISCDHVIMSYGTFGFWGSFLSGGQVLLSKGFGSASTAAKSLNRYFKLDKPIRHLCIISYLGIIQY